MKRGTDGRSPGTVSEELIKDVFHLSPDVRYVAVSRQGNLTMRERGELASASSPDSDRYEELLVNPTLLVPQLLAVLEKHEGEAAQSGPAR